jgi:hypothetical protein
MSLLSLGEEEEAVAAYERALSLDADTAHRSLFRPMLRLVTVAAGHPVDDEPMGPLSPLPRPTRRAGPGGPQRPDVG